ncbi:uncharacterized protein LOC124438183 [Xenia sp. Carnegie-2017]|uniref:uncharacterized protein LOC124438183 n=1 Tax=Xenia sp. Carnegie-2017 TaxID=2897299 RepID=UPI001F04B1A3|nr:uncharacterized protein LOC124438183 [Xenia sp. Carnegie-2017]
MNETNWPDQVVSLLLDTVRERESIWNTKSKHYKNRNMKNAHYQEILQAIKVELPNVDLPNIKDEPSTPNTVEFKKRFLTKDHKIKQSVHENLKSFPWLCGKYSTARPTYEMNYRHMYLEVDESKTEDLLKQEIDDKFE